MTAMAKSLLQEEVERVRAELCRQNFGLTDVREISFGIQFKVSDGTTGEAATINIYEGKKGLSTTIGGKSDGFLKKKLAALLQGKKEDTELMEVAEKPVFTMPNNPYGFENEVNFDGKWIGTDESGKGDFFGGLIIAGVWVDQSTSITLGGLGVKDSKTLSDKKIQELAEKIRGICRGHFSEVEILPAKYNLLYKQFQQQGKNLNHLLAWGHARVIENVVSSCACQYAITDKFANERFVMDQLMEKGRQIRLIQIPRAEQNIAVAAASVLARDCFIRRMDEMGKKFDMEFPKGASSKVVDAAKRFVAQYDRVRLSEVAKIHFKTYQEI